ncbi:hypothetical protein [Streptomyces sp. NPDC001985]|uniref:hypothetical protein n=1 Tax=Streptomyces sp. NPDC001985 TaxID=3154406 RepID=UPI0033214975
MADRPAATMSSRSGAPPEGCLATAIRIPVRLVALIVVVPLRVLWDLLTVIGRALRPVLRWGYENLLVPLGRALRQVLVLTARLLVVWPWRYLLVPLWTRGVARPLSWLWTHVLRYLLVVPLIRLWQWVLVPAGRGIAWVVENAVVPPLRLLWRHVLRPLGREVLAALKAAWRIGGHVSRAVGTVLKWLLWYPVRWTYRHVCTPVGHVLRDLWRPVGAALRSARATAREAGRAAWRSLGGGARGRGGPGGR